MEETKRKKNILREKDKQMKANRNKSLFWNKNIKKDKKITIQ